MKGYRVLFESRQLDDDMFFISCGKAASLIYVHEILRDALKKQRRRKGCKSPQKQCRFCGFLS